MDEYTFLVLAKLKADRLRLRREAAAERRLGRSAPPASQRPASQRVDERRSRSQGASDAVHQFQWREQS